MTTFYALKRRDAEIYVASNPDPALGQPYAETPSADEACAWPAPMVATHYLYTIPEPEAFEVVALARGLDPEAETGEALAA